jgi:hypothetical protein
VKLSATGDKELWVMSYDDWAAPLYCTPSKDEADTPYWMVQSAEYMGHVVDPQIRLKMQPHSVIKEDMRWVVPHGTLSTLAVKVPGITPRYYARSPVRPGPVPEVYTFDDLGEAPDFDMEFLREAYVRSEVASLGVFKTVWRAIVAAIAYRLLVENKPVDFGWFRIHALPYRANWKGFIASKHPRLHAAYTMSKDNRAAALKMDGVEDDLMRTDLMAVKRHEGNTLFQWSIEVEKKQSWYDYEQKLEQERCKGGSPKAYIPRWGTIVNRLRNTIHGLLFDYCRQTALACGIPAQVGDRGERRLVPYIPDGQSRGAVVARFDEPLVGSDGTTSVRGPEDKTDDRRKARKVQALPILRPDNPNLRDARGDMAKSRRDRKAGLLVHSADGGNGAVEGVLGGGQRAEGAGVE